MATRPAKAKTTVTPPGSPSASPTQTGPTAGPTHLKITGRLSDTAQVPALLQPTTRGTGRSGDRGNDESFIGEGLLTVSRSIDLSSGLRGAPEGDTQVLTPPDDEVLVIELADGGTLITHPVRLKEALCRNRPDLVSGDAIEFDALNADSGSLQRGVFGDAVGGIVSKVVSLAIGTDDINETAAARLLEKGLAYGSTKALMWAIEQKLKRPPGRLYAWADSSSQLEGDDARPAAPRTDAQGQPLPMLVFIHGTGSSTLGSFGDLQRNDRGLWTRLEGQYTGGIFAFEHRTLSESPIDNALQLVNALPAGARVSLVTHSRGGLVGDLLCLQDFDAEIDRYTYAMPSVGDGLGERSPVKVQLTQDLSAQQNTLRDLFKALREKKPVIERYVRVASPAKGTRLASGNFDVFLSGLLTLIGRVPYFFGNPLYAAFKRVVLEVARNRTDAHLVPGIEAMLPDSPMAALLRDAPVQPGIRMGLIAGDIQGGNLLMRLGVMLTDFLLFDSTDNDLVVDTAAMLGGVAPKSNARVLFDRARDVSHFNYFNNLDTRNALRDWLTLPDPAGITAFRDLPDRFTTLDAAGVAATRGIGAVDRPVVVVLPGIMGTCLDVDGRRIWLDPFALAKGRLDALRFAANDKVTASDLFGASYGEVCDYLGASHRVVPFPYDWRQPLDVLGERLGTVLELLLKETTQPIRLLAHSMGGLVVRASIVRRREVMDQVMKRDGARLVMLGTPHQGSHSMVEAMLGKGRALRALVRLDFLHGLQEVLDIIGSFRGALQLLPRPGFVDTFQGSPQGGEPLDYSSQEVWDKLQADNTDLWFGDQICATTDAATLAQGSWLWKQGPEGGVPSLPEDYRAKSIYIFGVAANTPCGVRREQSGDKTRLRMVGTTRGDGTVTWDSGRIGGIGSYYYLPAVHGDLLSTQGSFAALGELLVTGATGALDKTPPAVRSTTTEGPASYDPGPPDAVDPGTLAAAIVGGLPGRKIESGAKRRLEVRMKAMDLRFLASPILVGHYENDPIAGAESLIDTELFTGDLTQRNAMGLYAGPLGTAAVVLRSPNDFERRRGSLFGAVVTGLGRYEGNLSQESLMLAVRAGVLRFLLQVADVMGPEEREVSLASLLLGYNSSANLTVSASVEALVRGVMDANERFKQTTGLNIRIGRLEIVELYLDTAISAVYELRQLAPRLQALAEQKRISLVCGTELIQGVGVRQRLLDHRGASYWPRLIVTDADRESCAVAPQVAPCDTPTGRGATPAAGPTRLANRLRFLYVGQRARAESVVQQRQPSLIETLVRQQIGRTVWNEDFGRMLFQLIVPPDFKEAARQLQRIVLVVDEATANLPWELMLADPLLGSAEASDGPRLPLSIRTPVVRQLASSDFRRDVHQGTERKAFVIGNPSTAGFAAAFPDPANPSGREPPLLPHAETEATAIGDLLRNMGYDVTRAIGEDKDATTVLARLYGRPYRVLHISAHGVFDLCHADGQRRSGVVLSGGLLITAAEIAAMETVPELVFLNCCHLGQVDATPANAPAGQTVRDGNKLASSVARELIQIGVRCVVVAGWAVDDKLAQQFGEAFYANLLQRRMPFGEAVYRARRALWDTRPDNVTWGAFQAYGDPLWTAERPAADGAGDGSGPGEPFASLDEVFDFLARIQAETTQRLSHRSESKRLSRIADVRNASLQRCPPPWLALPALQSALAATWRDLGCSDQAREAYLAAIQAEDLTGRVPIRDIEQLANVEVRLGATRARQAADRDAGLALIDSGLERLTRLEALIKSLGTGAGTGAMTPQRAGLLGSGYKRKAMVYALDAVRKDASATAQAEARQAMMDALEKSVAAYAAGTGMPGTDRFSPYNALNRLALGVCFDDWNEPAVSRAAVALAQQCGRSVLALYAVSNSPWDVVMQPEAALVESLCDGSLAQASKAGDAALAKVVQAYRDALQNLGMGIWQLDSIVDQMRNLATFFDVLVQARPEMGYALMAERLRQCAQQLAPAR